MKIIISLVLIIYALVIPVTRAEFIESVMVLVKDVEAPEVDCPFTDIDVPEHDAIVRAYALKITAGSSATTFSPNDRIEPYQIFLFIGKALFAIERGN